MKKTSIQKQQSLKYAEKDSDDSMNAVAGLIRSFGRTAARALPKAGLGSFPMHGKHVISAMQKTKISVRTIGKYAQKLSNLVDYIQHWKNSKSQSHHRYDLFTKLGLRMRSLVPQIIKGSILGTVVFETYDNCMSKLNNNSVLSGAIAGLTHGICYHIWGGLQWLFQRGFAKYRNSAIEPNILQSAKRMNSFTFISGPFSGTLIAHIIAHSTLFSVFQFSKQFLINRLPSTWQVNLKQQKQASIMIEVIYIALAGALAGAISESSSYFTEPLDKGTTPENWVAWRNQIQQIRNLQLPKFKQVIRPSLLPSSLGFLAYQYGKFQMNSKQSTQQ